MWIGEQITARGVGNGISLIIFAGIVARFPHHHRPDLRTGPHRRDLDPLLIICCIVVRRRRWSASSSSWSARSGGCSSISQATGRQPHVRRRVLASAAEAQRLGRDSADLRVVDPAAADDDRQLQRRRTCRTGCRPSSPISAAASRSIMLLYARADPVLLLLLHLDRLQSGGDGGQSEEVWRRSFPASGPARGRARIHRLCADPHHRDRRALSGRRLPDPGIHVRTSTTCQLLAGRHLDPDRGQRHHGHGGADPEPSDRAAI